jgi:protein-tyrosine phosphatase
MLLGVADDDVMHDDLLTNDKPLPQLRPIFDRFEAAGGDPALLRPCSASTPPTSPPPWNGMRMTFGTIKGYFADGLDIDAATISRLRHALVE